MSKNFEFTSDIHYQHIKDKNELEVPHNYQYIMKQAKASFLKPTGPIHEEEMKLEDIIRNKETTNLKLPSVRDWLPEILTNWRLGLNCFIGGLIVAFITVPSSMAYCLMVDFPVKYGVNSCTFPLIVYSLFGTSKQMSIGPLATTYFILGQAVDFLQTSPEDRILLARTMTFLIGFFLILMGSFNLSFIENVFSEPIMFGYLQSTAFLIVFEQFSKMFQIKFHGHIWDKFYQLGSNLGNTNIYSALLGFSMIILLFLNHIVKKKYYPKNLIICVAPLIFTFGLTFISYIFDFQKYFGVFTAEDVPSVFPPFEVPNLNYESLLKCWPDALKISLVSFTASLLITKQLGRKYNYEINTTHEFLALGFANLIGSFFTSLPAFGSLCRSPIIELTNAKSQFAGFLTGIFVIIEVMTFNKVLEQIPICVISGFVFFSCSLIFADLKEVYFWYKHFKTDFIFFIITTLLCLTVGLANGLILSIFISLLSILKESSRPIWSFRPFETDEKKLKISESPSLEKKNTVLLLKSLNEENINENAQNTWLHHLRRLTSLSISRKYSIEKINNSNSNIKPLTAYDICLCHDWQCNRRCHLVVITLHGYLSYVNVKTLKEQAEYMTIDIEQKQYDLRAKSPKASMKRSMKTDDNNNFLENKQFTLDIKNIDNNLNNEEEVIEIVEDEIDARELYGEESISEITPENRKLSIRGIIFECTRLTKVDYTSAIALKGLVNDLFQKKDKILIKFSEMKPEIYDKFKVMKFSDVCLDQCTNNTMGVLFKCCSDILKYEALKEY